MASFMIGQEEMEVDLVMREKQRKEMENLEKSRRHYKKDSRYLEDLYTLTYQEDSSMEEDRLEEEKMNNKKPHIGLGLASLQVSHKTRLGGSPLTRSQSGGGHEGPWSLAGDPVSNFVAETDKPQQLQFASNTLDTNLHKILARRMAGGQGVSFRSCKLLTKAYYSLLRDTSGESKGGGGGLQDLRQRISSKDDPKLSWQTLLQTDGQQLKNIVAAYSALVKSLNEEVVGELINKDNLMAEQDEMLDTISELSDSLL